MKRILATTAIVALTATNAFAASHEAETDTMEPAAAETTMDQTSTSMDPMAEVNGMTISASELIGQRVYVRGTADAEIADSAGEPDADWEDIGEVGDVVVSQDGDIHAIVLDVGGFLGIGEKEVSTNMDELKFVQEEGSEDAYFIVYTGDRAALEEREVVDRDMTRDEGWTFYGDQDATDTAATEMDETEMAEEDMAEGEMAEEKDATAMDSAAMDDDAAETDAAEVEPTVALTEEADMGDEVEYTGLTANGMIGLSVYDSTEERIGEISELLISDDGQITDVIVDVGGFLGIGEKPVALSFDKITLMQDDSGINSASTAYTLEELEGLETWEG